MQVLHSSFFNNYLENVLLVAYPIAAIMLTGLLLGWLARRSFAYLWQSIGMPGVMLTAVIGVPVHELSHALMCILFGHKIDGIMLLNFSALRGGQAGYVQHSYNPTNPWQAIGTFFISMGPVFGGVLVIWAALQYLLPIHGLAAGGLFVGNIDWQAIAPAFTSLFSSLFDTAYITNPRWWMFMYIAVSIAAHMDPSATDYRSSAWGIVFILVVTLLATVIFGTFSSNVRGFFDMAANRILMVLVLAVFFGLINFALSYGIHTGYKLVFRK
ncbi:MAG: hypothetical protein ACM3PP_07070 [Candidatus Saccharibacteria bacterium]